MFVKVSQQVLDNGWKAFSKMSRLVGADPEKSAKELLDAARIDAAKSKIDVGLLLLSVLFNNQEEVHTRIGAGGTLAWLAKEREDVQG